MTIGGNQQLVADSLPFARSYQLEALEKALKGNTIVFLETGAGKTLIAIMLLRSYAHLLRKPSPFIAVFLVPTVVLVTQQSEVIAKHTDLKVGKYYGEMGVDFWNAAKWKHEKDEHEVLVMTPMILLNSLRHRFLRLDQIKVLIFDECHNARGDHDYACIMRDFYGLQLKENGLHLPRIFGMTASPIKAKASRTEADYWKQISQLENLMNSKVFTCESESVLAQYIPISTPKVKLYKDVDVHCGNVACITNNLKRWTKKHELQLERSCSNSLVKSAKKRLSKLCSTFVFCLTELGLWLAIKAAETLSRETNSVFSWVKLDMTGEKVIRDFSLDALKVFNDFVPSGLQGANECCITQLNCGYVTPKVVCLVETLLEYRKIKDLRCIVFVERIITAIVIRDLLNDLLPQVSGWRTEYTAGNTSDLQSQSRKEQNKIVEEFRRGTVNIIIATSMLEEGLDVQKCNLVIRFDPSATVCSFIQSRGRARMQDSDFVVLVKSEDTATLNLVKKFLASGDIMRKECLSHAAIPCEPLDTKLNSDEYYEVESTGAKVFLSSSVSLLNFYCSRLPADCYYKPYPRFDIDKESRTCTLHLPKNCPIQTITVQGNTKILKKLACLEACRKLHQLGALTDYLVPDIVGEEREAEESGYKPACVDEVQYYPPELVGNHDNEPNRVYYCYLINLQQEFNYTVRPQDIVLAVRTKLGSEVEKSTFDLDVDKGKLIVNVKYIGSITLTAELVRLCQRFQTTVFKYLYHNNFYNLKEENGTSHKMEDCVTLDYLLLPTRGLPPRVHIDWDCIKCILFQNNNKCDMHIGCSPSNRRGHHVHTKNGPVCTCVLENSLVYTPHNGLVYCINGTLGDLYGTSILRLKDGESVTYKDYYAKKHGVTLLHENEVLLKGRPIFRVQNCLQKSNRNETSREQGKSTCELPPELCLIILSPISISTFYSFSFLPSIIHRIESLLLAVNLIRMDHCMQNVNIPTIKVLEAITTKKCQEKFHLESLETLGDSFLKYAAGQQVFKMYQNEHEGLLTNKKERIISNYTLCKLGCDRRISGFIRNEPFDPKTWIVPGDNSSSRGLDEEVLSCTKVYVKENRTLKTKVIADVVEALIGAFLSTGGEKAAILFMAWLGLNVDFNRVAYIRPVPMNPEKHVNVSYLESLLNYRFGDATYLTEALTHGSYMLPEIPRCYQRLEFLGDSVLDYVITEYLYKKYPDLSPGMLTDLRSASVNNDCYALAAIKVGLHKHILHASQDLHRHINETVHNSEDLSSVPTFGWESETTYPKVLGDVIESLAGAIYVDSGYNKEIVFRSIRPLLEPMITPETLRLHPVRELNEICQKKNFTLKDPVVFRENGVSFVEVGVEACGKVYRESRSASDKNTAKRLACKAVLNALKVGIPA